MKDLPGLAQFCVICSLDVLNSSWCNALKLKQGVNSSHTTPSLASCGDLPSLCPSLSLLVLSLCSDAPYLAFCCPF